MSRPAGVLGTYRPGTSPLHRAPAGEWVGVRASAVIGPSGLGTATGLLFDERGHVGRTTQGLTVRPR